MQDLQNKFISFNDMSGRWYMGDRLYISLLINVIVGYLLNKNYTVYLSTNKEYSEIDGIIFFDNVIISIRNSLYSSYFDLDDYETFQYLLKVYLGQEVTFKLNWDDYMMRRLGEAYPHQLANISFRDITRISLLDIYYGFLNGIDLFNKQYTANWNERITNLFNWLDTVNVDLSKLQPVYQKLYDAAVRSINEQPEAPYYLVLSCGYVYIKVNKEQYFKIFALYVKDFVSYKNVDFYVDILNLEIIPGGVIEDEGDFLSEVFPQVFTPFFLQEWDIAHDFISDLDIRLAYASKLWVKYYDFLKYQTPFFTAFPAVKDLECTENSMFNYLKTLITENSWKIEAFRTDKDDFWPFLFSFVRYLKPFEKPDEEKGYWLF